MLVYLVRQHLKNTSGLEAIKGNDQSQSGSESESPGSTDQEPGESLDHVCDLLEQLLGVDRPGGVRGGAEDQQPGLVAQLGGQGLGPQEEVVFYARGEDDGRRVGKPSHLGIADPVRSWDYNLHGRRKKWG